MNKDRCAYESHSITSDSHSVGLCIPPWGTYMYMYTCVHTCICTILGVNMCVCGGASDAHS